MKRSAISFAVLFGGVLMLLLIGLVARTFPTGWLAMPDYAKAVDFWNGWVSMGGPPWWTPNFLGGTSLAFAWGYLFSNLWMLFWTGLLGAVAGAKVAALLCLPIGAAGVWKLTSLLAPGQFRAALAAAVYFLMPGIWVRLFAVEHFVVLCAFALLPWVLVAIERFAMNPRVSTALSTMAAFAALALTYSKIALLALPVLIGYGIWRVLAHRNAGRVWRSDIRMALMLGGFFLGVLPLLPALREAGFVAMFDFGPFAAWQEAFSTRSALQLLDRDAWISGSFSPGFANSTGQQGFYMGSIAMLVILSAVIVRPGLLSGGAGTAFRSFVVCALALFWLSFGPVSIASAHFETLRFSVSGFDWAPTLAWGLLIAQVVLLWKLVPGSGILKQVFATIFCAVYLLVPGFRLIEKIPMYWDIRAPFDFFQVAGPVFLAVALGLAGGAVWEKIGSSMIRTSIAVLAVVLVLWDVSHFFSLMRERELPRQTFDEFVEASQFLKSDPQPGSVQPLSGRYFYLLTPLLAERRLNSEAFQSYLQQRGFAALQAAGMASPALLETSMRLSGIGFTLSDEGDSENGKSAREALGGLPEPLERAFQNDGFVIDRLPGALAPAFVAADTALISEPGFENFSPALDAVRLSVLPVEFLEESKDAPFAGTIGNGTLKLEDRFKIQGGAPFSVIPAAQYRMENYQTITVGPVEKSGVLVVTQAWHPDWKVMDATGRERSLLRAAGALPAAKVEKGEALTFYFEPPAWYAICAWGGILAWTAWIVFAAATLVAGHKIRSASKRGNEI